MMSATEKVRIHRARKAAGEIVLKIVVHETLADRLVEAQLLAPHLIDDHACAIDKIRIRAQFENRQGARADRSVWSALDRRRIIE
jgi:hypothetical protein